MKMLKKFFALALATVTLAAAVFYITPAVKALAQDRYDVEWNSDGTVKSATVNNASGKYVFNGTTYVDYVAPNTNDPTPESVVKEQWSPADDARYAEWLATWGGGTAAAGQTVKANAGAIGQPGSEVVVTGGTPNGQPVAMFQSNDATNTLVAGAVGAIPTGTKITSTAAAEGSASYTAAKAAVGNKANLLFAYDIAATAAPTAQFAMSIPVPADLKVPAGKTLKVYLIVDGKATALDCGISQGRIVFGTQAFGTFAFVIE